MEDPEYVNIDEEGNEIQQIGRVTVPKWRVPKDLKAQQMLEAVGQKLYHSREEQSAVNHIVRASLSLSVAMSKYPSEWIDFCCEWAIDKRKKKGWVQLKGLVHFIMDKDKMQRWLDRWYSEGHPTPPEEDEGDIKRGMASKYD